MANPDGHGSTPVDAVRSLADETVEIVEVFDETDRSASIRVVRKGVGGVYSTERVGEGWIVGGGDGCGAAGGAPIYRETDTCDPPELPPDIEDGESFLTYCPADLGELAPLSYYYPED